MDLLRKALLEASLDAACDSSADAAELLARLPAPEALEGAGGPQHGSPAKEARQRHWWTSAARVWCVFCELSSSRASVLMRNAVQTPKTVLEYMTL